MQVSEFFARAILVSKGLLQFINWLFMKRLCTIFVIWSFFSKILITAENCFLDLSQVNFKQFMSYLRPRCDEMLNSARNVKWCYLLLGMMTPAMCDHKFENIPDGMRIRHGCIKKEALIIRFIYVLATKYVYGGENSSAFTKLAQLISSAEFMDAGSKQELERTRDREHMTSRGKWFATGTW